MKLTQSTENDIEQLTEWIKTDPYHRDFLNPHWWLTGNGLLSYCIQDSKGPTMYVRTDKEDNLMRLHCQFGPEAEVSKLRVIKSLLWALPKMEDYAKQEQLKGFIYKSINSTLIQFMQIKFGFTSTGRFTPVGFNDDYWMPFESREG